MDISNKNDFFCTKDLRVDVKNRAIRGAGATIFTTTLSFFVYFFSTIILARLLTPADFGLITMVTTFSLLLQNFGVNGFTESVIQREDLNHDMMSTLFWVNVFISLTLTLVFVLMAPFLVWFYKEPRLKAVSISMAFSIIASGMSTLHMAILRRNMKFYLTSGIEMIARIAGILVSILLAWFGFGYWALVANALVPLIIIAIGGWIFCSWRPGKFGSLKDIKPLLRFAIHTYGNFTLNYFSRNIDKLLIGWRFASQSLGYYKKAYDLFALPANQLVAPLANVALAALSRLVQEPDRYRHYYLNAISIIAFVGMPLSAVLTLSGLDITLFVLGPQWAKAGEVFCYFGASIGIMLLYGTQGWLHLSLGRPDRWVRWGIFECISTTAFFIVGLPFGIEGVAIGYALSFYVLLTPCLHYAGKPIGIKISSLVSAIWRFFVAALAAGLISYLIFHKLNHVVYLFNNVTLFFRIITASTICLVLYLLAVIILYQGFAPIKQFITILMQMIPRKTHDEGN